MLEALLYPKTIAIIGASGTPGKVGHEAVANLVRGGFEGHIVPVNPNVTEVFGLPCYPSLDAYPDKPDMCLVTVPVPRVRAAVEAAARAGAKVVVVVTAGFKESGPEGAELERELVAFCRQRGVRLLGPNCLGLINTHHRMNASWACKLPRQGNITVLSQSGALCSAILDWAETRQVGLAKLISIGNKADLDETDLLQALAKDEHTKVIVGYLESIEEGDNFVKVAESVASVKPVIIMKAGTTQAGVRAASSHTGSLAGQDIAYWAAFKRSGVIRAPTYESLFDYAIAFSRQPLPRGPRVAIVTNAGGPGIMAADAVEEAGMQVARLAPETCERLRARLPSASSVANPIDVLGDADADRYAIAVTAAEADPNVDATVVLLTPQAMTQPEAIARAIAASARGTKPILAAFLGGAAVTPGRDALVVAGIPDYPAPERAVGGLKAMVDYASWKLRPPRIVTRFPVNRRRVERILTRHLRTGQVQIGEVWAKEILRAYDFNVPAGRLVLSAEEAVEEADRIGYPVALKVVSPDILHKSDLGGVRLRITGPEAVRDAYDLMLIRVARRAPTARIEGVLVEKMAARGREVIIGMTRDPQFGPMLMFGLGGIFVEVMKDVTFHLAPITAEEATQMLMGTRSYSMLAGTRGDTAADVAGVAAALQRVSQLATDFPQIAELDINPLIVSQGGIEPVVADARMTITERAREGVSVKR